MRHILRTDCQEDIHKQTQTDRRVDRETDRQTGRLLTEQPRCSGFQNSLFGTLNDGFWQRERVSYHCAVQPVLRHNAASSPCLLRLAPLGSSVLEPHLHRHTASLNSSRPHVHTQYDSIPSSSRLLRPVRHGLLTTPSQTHSTTGFARAHVFSVLVC